MSRKPIGDRPMTAAERARRYRQAHPERKRPTRGAEIAALKAENAELKARLAAFKVPRRKARAAEATS